MPLNSKNHIGQLNIKIYYFIVLKVCIIDRTVGNLNINYILQ